MQIGIEFSSAGPPQNQDGPRNLRLLSTRCHCITREQARRECAVLDSPKPEREVEKRAGGPSCRRKQLTFRVGMAGSYSGF